jgi:hypothetical protein
MSAAFFYEPQIDFNNNQYRVSESRGLSCRPKNSDRDGHAAVS